MLELPDHVIGRAYRSRRLWEVLVDIASIENRAAGHEGESMAATVFESRLAEHADSVRTSEFAVPKWSEHESSLTVIPANDRRRRTYASEGEVIALSGSPGGSVSGELVPVAELHPEEYDARDLEGAIVLAKSDRPISENRWIHRMEKYAAAVDAGAAGFLFESHIEGCLPPAGEVGYGARPAPIPAVGISAELGARLRRYFGDRPEVKLELECEITPSHSQNVEGTVGEKTETAVVVTAHLDAHPLGEGAADNAAGCALLVELSRLLSRVEDSLETQVKFVGFGAEEIGLYGSTEWAENRDRSEIRCLINLDGVTGSETLHVGLNSFTSLQPVFEATTDALFAPLSTDSTIVPHGDQWAVVKDGIPGVMVSAASDRTGRGWEHTAADTTDKIDIRNLRSICVQIADVIVRIANRTEGFERKSREDVRELLDDHYVTELKARGQWPY